MDWRRSSNTTLRGWVEKLSLISDTVFKTAASRARFRAETFHGFDFDSTMLRIGSMNMLLHGIKNPDIRYKDSLAQSDTDDAERYSVVLANPPFAGSLDYESVSKDLLQISKTKKTELLFLALFLRLLQICLLYTSDAADE